MEKSEILPETANYILENEEIKCDRFSIWRGKMKKTGARIMAKVYSRKFIEIPGNRERLDFELECFRTSSCIFIASFIDFIETEENFVIILENCIGVQLSTLVSNNTKIGESATRQVLTQLFVTADYLNKILSIVHGNLDPTAFMENDDEIIKLIDFWGAFKQSSPPPKFSSLTPLCFTSPEVIKGQMPTPSTDIWSISAIGYCLACGSIPFDCSDEEELRQLITTVGVIEFPHEMSRRLVDLFRKTLSINSILRIKFEEITNHTWFSGSQVFHLLMQLNDTKLTFNEYVMESITKYCTEVEVTEGIAEYNKTGKVTEAVSIYKESAASMKNNEAGVILDKASAGMVMSGETKQRSRSSSVLIPLSFSKNCLSQPLLIDRDTKSVGNKLKPLVVMTSMPVQIAARRSSTNQHFKAGRRFSKV